MQEPKNLAEIIIYTLIIFDQLQVAAMQIYPLGL